MKNSLILSQDPRLLDAARRVASRVPRALLVGGFVRDALLGLHPKDADIEVYGMPPGPLEELLHELYPNRVNAVGRAFGILKIALGDGLELDVSLPRRESKAGKGHKGFAVQSDPSMDPKDAARRRDFTVNAIAADPNTGEIIDPYGGVKDLEARVLRVVDEERFQDDPLRVYRAIQFAARLGMTIEPQTFSLMKQMVERGDLAELSKERVTDEIKKLLLKAERPSIGFALARDLGIPERDYPELKALIGTPQEPEWHPEGDVWTHTLMVIDHAAKIIRRQDAGLRTQDEQLHVMLGALCHDLGKPATTKTIDGRIRSLGHEDAGAKIAMHLCERWSFGRDATEAARLITADHLKPSMLYRAKENGELTDAQYANAVRRLLKRLHPIPWNVFLAATEADWRGRKLPGTDEGPYIYGERMKKAIAEGGLVVQPLLLGRDLAELGVAAGPEMGKLLAFVEDARDRGEIRTKEEALAFVRQHLAP